MNSKSIFFIFLNLLVLFEFMSSNIIQEEILSNAKENINETAWAKGKDRQAKRNENVYVLNGEWKCNLFVYEIILASGYDIGTPNQVNCFNPKYWGICLKNKTKRPPCCKDWFDEKVPGFFLVGEDDKGRKLSKGGDIITNGIHIGIISNSKELTISANEEKIVETNFGFSEDDKTKTFKIFRYNGNNLNSLSVSAPIKTESESSGKYCNNSTIVHIKLII